MLTADGTGGSKWRAAAVLGLGLVAVFTVPYLFAHPHGHSQSYLAHFSNHVALLLVVACAAVLGWGTDVFGLQFASGRETGSRRPLWWVSGVSVLLVGVLWAVERRLGPAAEATYFLDRYAQQQLGAKLYRDLEFSYGPLLFWPQMELVRLFGLRLGDAHFLMLMLDWPAGLALIWYVCRRLAGERRVGVTLFLLLSGIWGGSILDGGMNYTPLRFLPGPALALWLWGRSKAGRPLWETMGLALAGFWGLVFISPEQGIAFGFGTVVFFGLAAGWTWALSGFAAGCGAGLLVAWRMGVLNTLLSIGGGSLDFPVLPSAPMVVVLGGAVLGGGLAARALRHGERNRPELYLTAICAALLPAALGRADAGHVFINTLPLLAIAYCALARTRAGFRWGTVALGGFLALSGAYHVWPFARMMGWRESHRAALVAPAGAVETKLLAPMGFPRAFADARPRPVVTGRYSIYLPLLNAMVPTEKVEELDREPDVPLVLPAGWRERCSVKEEDRRVELKIALHPWFYPRRRARDESAEVLCGYIAEHYRVSDRIAPAVGFLVLERRQ